MVAVTARPSTAMRAPLVPGTLSSEIETSERVLIDAWPCPMPDSATPPGPGVSCADATEGAARGKTAEETASARGSANGRSRIA